MYDKLLVGYDGSAGARAALTHAIGFAQIMGAQVWALWVRETIPYFAETVAEVAVEQDAAHVYFGKLKVEIERIEGGKGVEIHFHSQAGHAAEKIVRYAVEGGFDLIVLGSHGHTTDRVSEHAPCSVLIVRPEGRATEPRWSEEVSQ